MQPIAFPIWRLLVLLVWGTWWGGVFFYVVVVVPIGTTELGSVEQGFITQRVSAIHNQLSVAFLFCIAIEAIRSRSVWLGLLTIAISVNLCMLLYFHSHLTSMMNFVDRTVPLEFYNQHAVYLWLFASEWLQGILVPLLLFPPTRRMPKASDLSRLEIGVGLSRNR